MEKRLIGAIALSILVILLFQTMGSRRKVQVQPGPTQATVERVSPPREGNIFADESIASPTRKEETTVIETDKYILTFSNRGGSLENVTLKEYRNSKTDLPLRLVEGAKGKKAVFSLESSALLDSLETRFFTLTNKDRNKLVYSFVLPGRFRILKEYGFANHNDYIELQVSIENIGSDLLHRDYDLIGGSSLRSSSLSMGRRFSEIDSMLNGKIVRSSGVKGGEQFVEGITSWTGVKSRYFCVILKPMQESAGVLLKQFDKSSLASGIKTKRIPVYPGSTATDSYIMYIGPADTERLSALGFGFENIVSYGFFGGISKLLLSILKTFYKVSRNWGLAVIMLTLLVNMCLFPLTRKSFQSMKKIQDVQPHIEKLRATHKGNPQKLNKELAEVYKQYNINPLGGCLPLLLQMPIFIALYQGLSRSIELKGASFLWIKDLSSPDFVNIPFKLPFLGDQIHVLPLLMVGAMFLQQLFSTKHTAMGSSEQRQQQKIMLIFFPLFFGFLFYQFPSGLVLYWFTNTLLMTAEHALMRRSAS